MAHIDSRDAVAYYPDPCKLPISRFPMAAYMSVALNHLWQWLDKGTVPPHADRIYMDYNTDDDGSLMALDEVGNVKGGIRTTYVDLPTSKIGVPNSGAEPPIKNPHPFIAARGEAAQNQLCGLANYQIPLTQAQLKKLYKDKKDYQAKVQQRYDELMKQGWALEVYRSVVLGRRGASELLRIHHRPKKVDPGLRGRRATRRRIGGNVDENRSLALVVVMLLTATACTRTPPPEPDLLKTATIKDIMDSMVDPSAEFLFDSVATIADEHGITEKAPHTDEEWKEVRRRAIQLLEAPNLLVMKGRKVAQADDQSKNPEIELQPAQIQALIDGDRLTSSIAPTPCRTPRPGAEGERCPRQGRAVRGLRATRQGVRELSPELLVSERQEGSGGGSRAVA